MIVFLNSLNKPEKQRSKLLLPVFIGLISLIPLSHAQNHLDDSHDTFLHSAGILIIMLLVIIIILQRSRLKHKKTKLALEQYQEDLELYVARRTEELRQINKTLGEEVTQHQITERLLKETQVYFKSIINSMPSILIGVTPDGFVTHWNNSAEEATKLLTKDACGCVLFDVFPGLPIDLNIISETIKNNTPHSIENIQSSTGNQGEYVDITVYPLQGDIKGAVLRIDNITARVHLENMLIQNEKMMSLGELAAGMAHEINNPLSAILQGCQNILRRTSSELPKNHEIARQCDTTIDQIHQYLKQREVFQFLNNIKSSGERAARIVKNLLDFSRGNNLDHNLQDLHELINHSLEMAATTFEVDFSHIEVKLDYEKDLPSIYCSGAELQQVFLNLLKNASQAVTSADNEGKSPQIFISTAFADKENIRIIFEDNGQGMEESIKRHIFEPFFTTKAVGEGTGLGLSVSYFIITEHHGGHINVESDPGTGTKFILDLPIDPR